MAKKTIPGFGRKDLAVKTITHITKDGHVQFDTYAKNPKPGGQNALLCRMTYKQHSHRHTKENIICTTSINAAYVRTNDKTELTRDFKNNVTTLLEMIKKDHPNVQNVFFCSNKSIYDFGFKASDNIDEFPDLFMKKTILEYAAENNLPVKGKIIPLSVSAYDKDHMTHLEKEKHCGALVLQLKV